MHRHKYIWRIKCQQLCDCARYVCVGIVTSILCMCRVRGVLTYVVSVACYQATTPHYVYFGVVSVVARTFLVGPIFCETDKSFRRWSLTLHRFVYIAS